MNTEKKPSHLIVRATVMTQRKYLPAIRSLVRDYAVLAGLTEEEARHFEIVTEEACLNVIHHAFEDKPDEYFDVIVETRPARFVVAVEDRGFPMDWKKIEQEERIGFGIRLIKAFTDEVRFINLGLQGKRMEFIKDFSQEKSLKAEDEERDDTEASVDIVSKEVPIAIRLMRPDEGASLARCLYRVYGYSYMEYAYFPEKIRDLIESGLQVSMVALNPENEVVAHQGYKKSHPGSSVAEMGAGIVDPRYRGRGLFERIKKTSIDYGHDQGLYGLFIESVAVHPYSQKANRALGARETGILFGYIPIRFTFKKIDEAPEQRQAVVLMYNRLNREPDRMVYPPYQHRTVIGKIYENGGFNRTFGDVSETRDGMAGLSHVEINASHDLGMAFFKLIKYGADFQDCVRYHLRDMCLQKIDCIFLDLPLSNPATAQSCAAAEILGFFFAGMIPELDNGDFLRLQYLNNVKIDPSKTVVVSDFGKYLFDYIWRECERASRK
jgi:anti-sigma regulatory factor (Ser/Thr protein kinase)/RimJ/RimL family protein N-acetyltransferase